MAASGSGSMQVCRDATMSAGHDRHARSSCSSSRSSSSSSGLIVFALRDLLRPERHVRGDSKLMWGLIIVFISLLGPILYFVVGREPE